ncbi:hypothetical protein JKG47_10020 [Acidithiobacillus sp. MC6.1]|nr:hypothetical protein [Acidithiobacillus sp. MC6.1]
MSHANSVVERALVKMELGSNPRPAFLSRPTGSLDRHLFAAYIPHPDKNHWLRFFVGSGYVGEEPFIQMSQAMDGLSCLLVDQAYRLISPERFVQEFRAANKANRCMAAPSDIQYALKRSGGAWLSIAKYLLEAEKSPASDPESPPTAPSWAFRSASGLIW